MTTATRNGRGHPLTVTMRRTTALAPILEGIALADETICGADRIYTAAVTGSRQQVINEAAQVTRKAQGYRTRFREMAGGLEE